MPKLTKKEQQQYDQCLGQCTVCMIKPDCKLRLKIREIKLVDVIVNSYEWICPDCEHYQYEDEWKSKYTCLACKKEWETNPPEHALGK